MHGRWASIFSFDTSKGWCRSCRCIYVFYIFVSVCLSARDINGQLCPSFLKPQEQSILFLKRQGNQPHFEAFSSPELFLMIDKLMSGFTLLLVEQLPSKLFMFLLLWPAVPPSWQRPFTAMLQAVYSFSTCDLFGKQSISSEALQWLQHKGPFTALCCMSGFVLQTPFLPPHAVWMVIERKKVQGSGKLLLRTELTCIL